MAAASIAAIMEGPAAKGYLMVADARSATTTTRAFTTLSTSLGQLVVCTHAGLMHALQHEPNTLVLMLVLHAVCMLTAAAPADRLPPDMLPTLLETVRNRCQSVINSPLQDLPMSDQHSFLLGYISCIAEVLSTKKPIPNMAKHLSAETGVIAANTDSATVTKPNSLGESLARELLSYCAHAQPTIRIEALAALRGLAENYMTVLYGLLAGTADVVSYM
jgi:hypothetical protein